ncbi:MAG: hypothetical protein WC471_03645 [Candidatus Woesearchaeota archaeon]
MRKPIDADERRCEMKKKSLDGKDLVKQAEQLVEDLTACLKSQGLLSQDGTIFADKPLEKMFKSGVALKYRIRRKFAVKQDQKSLLHPDRNPDGCW